MTANVLICGLVRDSQKLKEKINRYSQLKKEGLLNKIVFSTWENEIDRYDGLKDFLKEKEVILVITEEPKLIVPGHRYHQMKAFYYGLQLFDDNDLVLKSRVDLAHFEDNMPAYFNGEISLARTKESMFDVLSERVVVEYIQLIYPFLIGDAQFFGRKKDIQQFVNMDYFYDIAFANVAVEQSFFSKPFIDKFPLMGLHFFWNLPHICQANNKYEQQINYLLSSEHFLNLLATYHQILNANFMIGWLPKHHYQNSFVKTKYGADGLVDIEQIFSRKDMPYGSLVGHEGSIPCHSNILIERLANGHVNPNKLGQQYLDALARTKNSEYQRKFTLNPANTPSDVLAFYKELTVNYAWDGYSSKILNNGNAIAQENHFAGIDHSQVFMDDKEIVYGYQEEIKKLRTTIWELGLEITNLKYPFNGMKVSLLHKIVKKWLPESLLAKIRNAMPRLIKLYREYVK